MSTVQTAVVSRRALFGERRRSEKREAAAGFTEPDQKLRVYVAAENRLLREALARVLRKAGRAEVLEQESSFDIGAVVRGRPDILLLASRGNLAEDLSFIQQARSSAPQIRILLIGMARNESEFLQCVSAGISGYLLGDASAEQVLAAVRAVQAGEAVCPGTLCTLLFHYFQQDAPMLPRAGFSQQLKLSRRQQQLLPLIAEGLTNREIAGRLCLSEQTVKNHLYRMKRRFGAQDRIGLVQLYQTQAFLLKHTPSEKQSC